MIVTLITGGYGILFLFLVFINAFGNDFSANHWLSCNGVRGTTIPFKGSIRKPKFVPECAPEVLYSWSYLSSREHEAFLDDPLIGRRELYTWRTPLGTFGYGSSLLRLKLKPNTKFKWIKKEDQNCIQFAADEKQNTVYVSLVGESGISEYFLCDPGVIESWSKNSLGAKLEAEKELDFIKNHLDSKLQTYDSYGVFSKHRKRLYVPAGDINLYFPPILDQHTVWTQEKLERNLDRLGKRLQPHDDQVFNRTGVSNSPREHYWVNRPTYFNLDQDF